MKLIQVWKGAVFQNVGLIKIFLETFETKEKSRGKGVKKYMNYITEVKELKRSVIPISLEDVASSSQSTLLNNITVNAVRYVELFEDVIDTILPSISKYEEPVTATDILNVGELNGVDL